MWKQWLYLALAGGVGTLSRYGLAGVVQRMAGTSFPWGTLAVNVTGCFLAGLLWSLFEYRIQVPGEVRMVVLMGFMGAFTTFSAYMIETGELLRSAEWLFALGNVVMQNGIGFVALYLGLTLGRLV